MQTNYTDRDLEFEKNPDYFPLERNSRLSQSKIWTLLEDYYQKASISAWNQIPFYPTSNPYIADCYADIIFSFLDDCADSLEPDKPVFILEMAAGTGCFSFYLLKELRKRQKYFSSHRNLKIHYIMADFTPDNPANWMKNQRLQPFLSEGMLSFGIFRPQDDLKIISYPNNEILLEKGACANPLITIANYFFDSIKQDAFQIQNGELMEVRQTFWCKKDSESPEQIKFENLEKTESYSEINADYYPDKRMNMVLHSYCEEFKNASIIFPLGAFQCISNLLEISEEKLLLISSDKGFTNKDYLVGRREQPFVAHHGVFSYSVNYDALRRYFEGMGGWSFNTTDDNLSVSLALNCYVKNADFAMERSKFNFEERVDRLNPPNYLYFLQDILIEVKPKQSNELLRACMGYIQLCNYDPVVFCLAAPCIYFALETIYGAQEKRLLEILERVKENFYSVQQQYDVFYWMGRIYYGLNRLDEAMKSFSDSMLTFGQSSSSLYYMAACYEVRKDYKTALRYYEDTLLLEPDCEYTQGGIKRIKGYLAAEPC